MRFSSAFIPRISSSIAAAVLALVLIPRAASARAMIIEDSPGRLVLEVTVGDYRVGASVGGSRVTAPGFGMAAGVGEPDLPWYHFQVATGNRSPSVSVEPLEWVELPVPGGLAGVPAWPTNLKPEARKDPVLFAAARGQGPKISEIHTYRGMPLRHISVPLGTYVEGEGRVRALKRFRVRVDFPSPGAASSPGARTWLRQADVMNAQGGAYLVSPPRPAPLRKVAAASFDPASPWLKIRIGNRFVDDMAEDGVYALTYEMAASKSGFPAGLPIGDLRVYTGPKDAGSVTLGGAIAPTLREIPIEVRDAGGNGTFDAGDTLFFYAHGTGVWVPIAGATGPVRWIFKSDPWSFENYYYLQWAMVGGSASRLSAAAGPAAAETVTVAPHYLRAERDLAAGVCDPSGAFDDEASVSRYWYGRFSCNGTGGPTTLTASQLRGTALDSLPGRASDSAWIGFSTIGPANNSGNAFTPWHGGLSIPFVDLGIRNAWYLKTTGFGGTPALFDSVRWSGAYVGLEGYTVRYQRSLQWTDGRLVFPATTGQRIAYKVTGAPAGAKVLRVASGVGTGWLTLDPVDAATAFSDSVGTDEDVVYYFVPQSPLPLTSDAVVFESGPTGERVVRDLRDGSIGGSRRNPDYLILAPEALLPEAIALAKYRDDAENPGQPLSLRPAIVRIEDVYRGWSGGRLSPVAIRDFLRWARDRWGAGDTPGDLKYVLLFGDGHFDYRNFRNGTSATAAMNHVPPFNSNEELNNPLSSDDFYGVLDSAKHWATSSIDLAVGRLPLQTREQARNYLDKIAAYENPANSGSWRSRALMTADDATQRRAAGGRDPIYDHVRQSEEIASIMLAQDSGMRKETTYLFDYPHNGSFLKPEATEALLSGLNQGMLLFTFFGHGAYNQLADEVFLKTNDGLSRLKNGNKAFGMLIFSCTVGRFDKLVDEGMVEQFVRQKDGGAMFGIAGSRETYSDRNEALGKQVFQRLFEPATDSVARGIGEVLRLAKNGNLGHATDNRKYAVVGEPVLVVNRPGLGLRIDARPDSLQALGCDTLRGRVDGGSGRGAINMRIVSGDVTKLYATWAGNVSAKKRGQILFERTVPYSDSAFEIPYFLPKQVPFGDTAAKMQLFAWDSLTLRESALLVAKLPIAGSFADGGCLVDDSRGPRITVTGCNAREAGEVDFPDKIRISLPYCLQIAVSDTGGGVLAGDGPDQGVTVEVTGAMAPYQPQATVDDLYLKTYQVQLSPQQIADGTHLLKVSARDGFGNLTQRQISMQVAQDTALRFVRAFNTPNPLKRGETTFWFSTVLPLEEGGDLTSPNQDRIRFHLRVFNQAGKLVREFRNARSGETRWDGRDAWGQVLANGVYFYEVSATWGEADGGPVGGRRVSRRNTLVISR